MVMMKVMSVATSILQQGGCHGDSGGRREPQSSADLLLPTSPVAKSGAENKEEGRGETGWRDGNMRIISIIFNHEQKGQSYRDASFQQDLLGAPCARGKT
jgi:hypothetical protein